MKGEIHIQSIKSAAKAALPCTLPVFFGYLFIGIAFGVLMQANGYAWYWAVFMSIIVYAGSMQFVAVSFLGGGVSLLSMIMMTLFVNLRHVCYGISMLSRFEDCGKLKPYLIFALTDETFSLEASLAVPKDVDKKWFLFFISFFDQCYWILGTIIGAIADMILPFSTEGIDFSMTALFIVILIDQWREHKDHVPAIISIIISITCLILFGKTNFLLPTMMVMVLCLVVKLLCERRAVR